MTEKKLGGQTAALACPPVLAGWANVVGQKEGAGPLGPYFYVVAQDDSLGQPSWERAERLISVAHPKFRDQLWEAYYERYGKEDQ